jgi:hypothetical protein
VILIDGAQPQTTSEDELRTVAHQMRASGSSARDIVELLTAELGAPRNLAYRLAHEE